MRGELVLPAVVLLRGEAQALWQSRGSPAVAASPPPSTRDTLAGTAAEAALVRDAVRLLRRLAVRLPAAGVSCRSASCRCRPCRGGRARPAPSICSMSLHQCTSEEGLSEKRKTRWQADNSTQR
jgi:hypothetical protein